MEKERQTKVFSIIALVVAIAGLSFGFAAFSNMLTISSRASVTPNSDAFKVVFSTESDYVENKFEDVEGACVFLPGVYTGGALFAASGCLEADQISGLDAYFTAPGQTVTYTAYVHNIGEYDAYLRGITYGNASGASTFKSCVATSTETTGSLVSAACEDISVSVIVGEKTYDVTDTSISGHKLAVGASESVVFKITYAADGARADGEFNVSFGNISLDYRSADAV